MGWGNSLVTRRLVQSNEDWRFYVLVGLAAVAMGIQNATFRRAGHQKIRTTYITGMLTKATEGRVALAFWRGDRRAGRPVEQSEYGKIRGIVRLCGGIWVGYVIGATVGGYVESLWVLNALSLPLAGLVAVIVFDMMQPAQDERLRWHPSMIAD
jgi:uncharacterized membrane protein YoaK (UPF0700 family)